MTDSISSNDTRGYLKAINILFWALFGGVCMFLIIIIGLNLVIKKQPDETLNKIFVIGCPVIALTCLAAAFVNHRKDLNRLVSVSSLDERLDSYRAIFIKFMALCEGAALFSVIALFITGDYRFILITAIMLIAMLLKRPTKQRLIDELQLDFQEQQMLD